MYEYISSENEEEREGVSLYFRRSFSSLSLKRKPASYLRQQKYWKTTLNQKDLNMTSTVTYSSINPRHSDVNILT